MEAPTRLEQIQRLLSELGGQEIVSTLTSHGRLRWWVVQGHTFIVQERHPNDVEVLAPLVEAGSIAEVLQAIRERVNPEAP